MTHGVCTNRAAEQVLLSGSDGLIRTGARGGALGAAPLREAAHLWREVTVHVLVDAVWCQGGALAGSQGVPAASWSSAWRALIPFLRVVER